MDQKLLARIVRVEACFAARDPKLGTGFRLAPGKVLTAQHVLEHRSDDGVVERAFEIRVWHQAAASAKPTDASAKVLWRGEEKGVDPADLKALDAALLDDEIEADGLEPFERWVRLPQPTGKWEGAGFARASLLSEKLFHPEGLSGTFDPIRDSARCLPLLLDRLPPAGGATWGGISGAPVFVAEGRLAGSLYGVVRKLPTAFKDSLYAVATPALLRAPGFREALGLEEPAPPHERLIVETRRLLLGHPELARHLASLDDRWRAEWAATGDCEGLLEAMAEHGDLATLLNGLMALAAEEARNPAELARLRESASYLVALLAQHELARRGRHLEAGTRKAGIASPNFLEMARAAAEGRRAFYHQRANKEPGAELQVRPTRLEAGGKKERREEDQLDDMFAKLVKNDFGQPPWLTDTDNAITEMAPEPQRLQAKAKAIGKNLRWMRRTKGGSPYLVLTKGACNEIEAKQLESFLKHLAILLPDLDQTELEGDAFEALELEELLLPLWEILGIN